MKSKTLIVKLMAALCVVAMLFSFAGCVDEDKINADIAAAQLSVTELESKLNASIDAVKKTADAAATKAALEEVKASLETAATAADVKALQEKLAAAEATLKTLATTEDLKKVSDSVTEAKNALEKSVTDAQTALNTAISTLETSLKAMIDKNKNDIAAINSKLNDYAAKTDVTALQNRVNALETALGEVDTEAFAKQYTDLTKLLKDSTYKYSYDKFEETVNQVTKVDPYADSEIKKFEDSVVRARFFLARAVNEADLEYAFGILNTAKNALKKLDESLKDALDAIKVITLDDTTKAKFEEVENCYTKLNEKLAEKDPAKTVETEYATIYATYTLKTGAYSNLKKADEKAKEVESTEVAGSTNGIKTQVGKITLPLVHQDSESAVAALESAYTAFRSAYFAKAEYNKLYVDGEDTDDAKLTAVVDALSGGKEIKGFRARLTKLAAAANAAKAIKLIDTDATTGEGNTNTFAWTLARPLYNDNRPATLLANIKAWAESADYKDASDYGTYEGANDDIELVNIKKIFTEEAYTKLVNADTYVKAMNAIYTTYVKGEGVDLIGDINALYNSTSGFQFTLESITEANTYNAAIYNVKTGDDGFDGVDKLITKVTNYDSAKDGNALAMISQTVRDNLAQYRRLADKIDGAVKTVKDTFYTSGAIDSTKVTFANYKKIEDFKTSLTSIYAETAGYNFVAAADKAEGYAITSYADAIYDALMEAYKEFTSKAADAWKKAQEILTKINENGVKLDQGKQINSALDAIVDACSTYGFEPTDVVTIVITAEDGTTTSEPVNFRTLSVDFEGYVTTYAALAKKAFDEVGTSINGSINTMETSAVNAADLSNYNTITALWKAIIGGEGVRHYWFSADYFTESLVTGKKYEDMLGATADVVINGQPGKTYAFLTAADYAKVKTWNETAENTLTAEKAAFKVWKDKADALLAKTMSIHLADDFAKLDTEYQNLWKDAEGKALYYGVLTGPTTSNQLNGERTAYETFKAQKDICDSKKDAASGAATTIIDLINGLPELDATAITSTNAASTLTSVGAIEGLLDDFYATYCTDNCYFVTESNNYLLHLARVKGVAQFVDAYDKKVAAINADTDLDDAAKAAAIAAIDARVSVETVVSAMARCADVASANYNANYYVKMLND